MLLVTHETAQEVDGVIDSLRENGISVERWNLCRYPARPATATSTHVEFGADAEGGVARVGWLHDTGAYSISKSLSGLKRELALRECDAFWQGAMCLGARRWLNHPNDVYRASNKLWQLQLAEQLRIPFPAYIATNDARKVREFCATHPRTVAKAVRGGYVVHPENTVKLVTRRVSGHIEQLAPGLKYNPIIVQREVEKAREVRVTVVGRRAFAMTVDCRLMPSEIVDIRLLDFAKNRWRFTRGPLSHPLLDWSLQFVQASSLSYAGIDWALTESGEAYFLECNPLGSFKWAEICTGHDITGEIAKTLIAIGRKRGQ